MYRHSWASNKLTYTTEANVVVHTAHVPVQYPKHLEQFKHNHQQLWLLHIEFKAQRHIQVAYLETHAASHWTDAAQVEQFNQSSLMCSH
jgi:hypothetical protein